MTNTLSTGIKVILGLVVAAAGCATSAPSNVTSEPSKPSAAAAGPRAACSPSCSDASHAMTCGDDGKPVAVDCGKQGRRCIQGVCGAQLCKPNELHCYEGQLYKCDASGGSRKMETACRPDGICLQDPKQGGAKCVKSCPKEADKMLLATYECEACDFKDVPFCAKTGPETTCSHATCHDGEITAGASMGECERETDGLLVPGSEKRGNCEKGTALVQYEVCLDGKPEKRTRVDACP